MNKSTDLIRASSVYQVLDIIGDRWTITILQQSFLGIHGFEDFQKRLGIPRSTLSSRLKRLIEYGVFEQRPATAPDQRQEYRLTPTGKDLLSPALLALSWQTNWVENTSPALLLHKPCGAVILPELVCQTCQRAVQARDVKYSPGPGAHRAAHENHRRRRSTAKAAPSDVLPVSEELLEILGDRWTPQVLALEFFGIRRFDDMLSTLDVASNILTDRLKRLMDIGMLCQKVYQQRPPRREYLLTEKGHALYPLLVGLTQWGDRWFSAPDGKPIRLEHIPCGHELEAQIICQNCREVIEPGSTVAYNQHANLSQSG